MNIKGSWKAIVAGVGAAVSGALGIEVEALSGQQGVALLVSLLGAALTGVATWMKRNEEPAPASVPPPEMPTMPAIPTQGLPTGYPQ